MVRLLPSKSAVLWTAIFVALLIYQTPSYAQSARQIVKPDANKVLLLVRTSLLTLNDALQTGNFTVLRDRGGPEFRRANTAARLSLIFSKFAQQQIDLSNVATQVPKLTLPPHLGANNHLRIKGFFPGQSVQLHFDLQYRPENGIWRLFGISINSVKIKPKPPQNSARKKLKK